MPNDKSIVKEKLKNLMLKLFFFRTKIHIINAHSNFIKEFMGE
jgi:hypothetical protein